MAKLTYRGVGYHRKQLPDDLAERAAVVQHEAPSPNIVPSGVLPVPQPVHRLTYRGVSYEKPIAQQPIKETAIAQRGIVVEKLKPAPVPTQNRMAVRTLHTDIIDQEQRQSFLQYLQSCLKEAKATGDLDRVLQLRQEIQLLF
ncbi:MAG: DUF4278 domain-containing protein [Aphanocapsa sp. GSE-SYN-MK-11-07L]|jgi:hypothetical protein|nr:DUF4278 domain-containing protein [Aphanocapsa sp. GSE-SYN-MK-11-07L]